MGIALIKWRDGGSGSRQGKNFLKKDRMKRFQAHLSGDDGQKQGNNRSGAKLKQLQAVIERAARDA